MITYNQMVQFVAVVRNHSITKAAEELFIAQPAISATIKKIESELTINLFFYENKQMYLTENGEQVYKIISNILALYQELTAFANQENSQIALRKKFSYYAAPSIHDHITPRLQLFDVFPQIQFSLINCDHIEEFRSAMETEENIFGIFHILDSYLPQFFSYFSDYTVDIITTLPSALLTSTKNSSPIAQKISITLAEIKKLPLLRCPGAEFSITQYLNHADLSFCMDASNATHVDMILQKKPDLYTLGHNLYVAQYNQRLISIPITDLPQVNLVFVAKSTDSNQAVFTRISALLHSFYDH